MGLCKILIILEITINDLNNCNEIVTNNLYVSKAEYELKVYENSRFIYGQA